MTSLENWGNHIPVKKNEALGTFVYIYSFTWIPLFIYFVSTMCFAAPLLFDELDPVSLM